MQVSRNQFGLYSKALENASEETFEKTFAEQCYNCHEKLDILLHWTVSHSARYGMDDSKYKNDNILHSESIGNDLGQMTLNLRLGFLVFLAFAER